MFVNGRFAPELSDIAALPAGVRLTSLASSIGADAALVESLWGATIKFQMQGFTDDGIVEPSGFDDFDLFAEMIPCVLFGRVETSRLRISERGMRIQSEERTLNEILRILWRRVA